MLYEVITITSTTEIRLWEVEVSRRRSIVITSYSIHYTKLYEAAGGQHAVQLLLQLLLGLVSDLVTSQGIGDRDQGSYNFV